MIMMSLEVSGKVFDDHDEIVDDELMMMMD